MATFSINRDALLNPDLTLSTTETGTINPKYWTATYRNWVKLFGLDNPKDEPQGEIETEDKEC